MPSDRRVEETDQRGVLERLSDLVVRKGVPDNNRSDNGSEFTAERVRAWLERVGVKTLLIEPGSPRGERQRGEYMESFNGKPRDKFLAREVFDTLLEPGKWRLCIVECFFTTRSPVAISSER